MRPSLRSRSKSSPPPGNGPAVVSSAATGLSGSEAGRSSSPSGPCGSGVASPVTKPRSLRNLLLSLEGLIVLFTSRARRYETGGGETHHRQDELGASYPIHRF